MEPTMTIPSPESIGAHLRAAMKERQMDHTTIAARMGVSTSTLARFLNGTSVPSFIQIIRAAYALDYPLDWFMGDGDEAAA